MELSIPHPRHRASVEEIRHAKSIIMHLGTTIENLEVKIKDMNSVLHQLQQKKANYKSYIAPFRQLPDEVLREIVLHCLHLRIPLRTLLHVCGPLRDVILGMTSVWSDISLEAPLPRRAIEYWNGTLCRTPKYLELVLGRAKSTPLKLKIAWDAQKKMLEPIISGRFTIQSLKLDLSYPVNGVSQITDFSGLNFSSLNQLHLIDANPDIVKQIMDLALQASSEAFTFTLKDHARSITGLLRHDFVQQAIKLNFSTGTIGPPSPQNQSEIISLPRIKICDVKCNPRQLILMDLSNAKEIRFESSDEQTAVIPGSLPSQLTRLELVGCHFDLDATSSRQTQAFSALTTLRIHNTWLEGALNQHFVLPELRELHLCDVIFFLVDGYRVPQPIPEDIFFGVPQLEYLVLSYLDLGEGLMDSLKDCRLLQQLTIKHCESDEFIDSFTSWIMADDNIFSNLRLLHTQNCWPDDTDTTYEDFVEFCSIYRSLLHITSGPTYHYMQKGPQVSLQWAKTPSEGDEEESVRYEDDYYYDDDDDDDFEPNYYSSVYFPFW
ncbi:hypothetical protein CPB86DRAFT_870821 [Serendipita vermifera]|nr:hypothetical protein CPB86DRAFT_870821 [Serendipita vermifera]